MNCPDIKVGDKILIRKPSDKEKIICGKVKHLNSEVIEILQPEGKKVKISRKEIMEIQIVEAKISIFREALGWITASMLVLIVIVIFVWIWIELDIERIRYKRKMSIKRR